MKNSSETTKLVTYLSAPNNVHIDVQESYEDYFDPLFPRWIALVIFIIGILGNFVSILVFFQKKMQKNSTFVYLSYLCVVDLLVILLGLGDILFMTYFHVIIRNRSALICRFHTFLIYASTHLSSFILASVSVDRAIASNWFNFARTYCKPKNAYRVLIVNFLLVVLINFHSLLFLGHESKMPLFKADSNESLYEYTYQCSSKNGTLYDRFLDPYFQWMDLIFYAIAPFVVMASATILILRVIIMSNKRMHRSLTNGPSSIHSKSERRQRETLKEKKRKISRTNSLMGKFSLNSTISTKSDSKSNARYNKTLQLTYMLISINALFFFLVSPLAISYILIKGKESVQYHKIFFNIVYLLAYSSHSFNFIFYGLSSPPYRQSLKKLFKFK
jgi:hypothetical protein